ncbi:hypothetical protein [Micromonospora sp. CA-111912]|uniref:hypothetical protein n=1 Tax=Micromonospora sp. CA-111912 TaxID=3239955 RepID=UPI003D8A9D7D
MTGLSFPTPKSSVDDKVDALVHHEHVTEPQPAAAARRKLARDVGVNVLANLIAAAIIFLLAVAGDFLTANPLIVAGVAILLAATAGIGLYVWFDRRDFQAVLGAMTLYVMLVGFMVLFGGLVALLGLFAR